MKKAKKLKHKINLVYVSPEANPEFNTELKYESDNASLLQTDDIVDKDVFVESGEELLEIHSPPNKKLVNVPS